MQVKLGCTFIYESPYPTPMIFLVRPRDDDRHQLVAEERRVTPEVPVEAFYDSFGNQAWRLVAPEGRFELYYDAVAELPRTPDPTYSYLPQTPVEELPPKTLTYTLPSRYCDFDMFSGQAWDLFGNTTPGWPRVQAICDWMAANITYGPGSTSQTTGFQAFEARRAVCRDFAHIAICFCRALNIPARYVCGYLPDIDVPPDPVPMDFHAWFEAYLGGAWQTFDARHNKPRTGRVVIARGRDAVDVAMTTSYGPARLQQLRVWADEVVDAQPEPSAATPQEQAH